MNNVPPVVMPHGTPTRTISTVYAPPPASVTCNWVLANPSNQDPTWKLALGVPHSASCAASHCSETVTPRAAADSPRVYTTGTLTQA